MGYFTILFPDSNVRMEYTSGYGSTNWASIGQVFDPKGSLWQSQATKIDSNDEYSVDSIAIPYRYFRYQTLTADTLVIQIFTHDRLLDYSLTSNQRKFKTGEYDPANHRGTNTTQDIVEILDDNDTSSNGVLYYPVNINVNRGEVLAVAITYFPGHPYSPTDTLFSTSTNVGYKLNRFDQFYFSDPDELYADGYFNSSLTIPFDVFYNTGTSWDGIFVSGIAYTSYIHHNMYFKLTAGEVGIKDAEKEGFYVGQNSPNPTSDVTSINYRVQRPTEVSLEVYDITGKSVMLVREGYKNAGSYRTSINVSELNSGVYYYTFRTAYGQVTRRMLVQH
jgi:hypothetical protein